MVTLRILKQGLTEVQGWERNEILLADAQFKFKKHSGKLCCYSKCGLRTSDHILCSVISFLQWQKIKNVNKKAVLLFVPDTILGRRHSVENKADMVCLLGGYITHSPAERIGEKKGCSLGNMKILFFHFPYEISFPFISLIVIYKYISEPNYVI